MTIATRTMSVVNPDAIIGFERHEFAASELTSPVEMLLRERGPVFGNNFLTIGGIRAVDLSYSCPSCTYIFERIDAVDLSVSPHMMSSALNAGITDVQDVLLNTIQPVLPTGDYVAALLPLTPTLVYPGTPEDYFANEYGRCTNKQHDPLTAYYRSRSFAVDASESPELGEEQDFHELVVPLYEPHKCDRRVVNAYREMLSNGEVPTALAISVFDLVGVDWFGWDEQGNEVVFEPHPNTQWVLTHYLLDGHHKVLAASQEGREIQILSLLREGRHSKLRDNLYRILDRGR